MTLPKKKVYITGIAGFIGMHCALALHRQGIEVAGIDNFNLYYDPLLKKERAELLEGCQIKIVRGDICDREILHQSISSFKPTHILHLAAQAGVRYSLQKPQDYIDTNITGFLNILEACRQFPSIKLIYASSSSVYGLNKKVPFHPSDQTDHPANLYGATKKSNELMAHAYHHCFGIHTTGLRFFTVYGPWGRPDMAYYSFAEKMCLEEPIPLFNRGEVARDFTYIDDIVAGTLAALDQGKPQAVYNLGNSTPHKVGELVNALQKHLSADAKVELLPMQTGDVLQTHADIASSQKDLSYNPTTSLDDGIAQFCSWYQKRRERLAKGPAKPISVAGASLTPDNSSKSIRV